MTHKFTLVFEAGLTLMQQGYIEHNIINLVEKGVYGYYRYQIFHSYKQEGLDLLPIYPERNF